MKASNKCIFITLLGVFLCTQNCLAQKNDLELQDIKKIELYRSLDGFFANGRRWIEIVPDSNKWKCYQVITESAKRGALISSLPKKHTKDIDSALITSLLKIVKKRDTAIHPDLFHVEKQDLIKYVDTVDKALSAVHRAELVKILSSKKTIENGLRAVLRPMPADDKSYYSINIITQNNDTLKIDTYVFANVYRLPWHFDGIDSYDPNITRIYEAISADGHDYMGYEKRSLPIRIDQSIYREQFRERFHFEDFQTEHPTVAGKLHKSLVPVYFNSYQSMATGLFYSKKLPRYIQIPFQFDMNSEKAADTLNNYEDSLKNELKPNFLTKYLKQHPSDIFATIYPYYQKKEAKHNYQQLALRYTALSNYDYTKIGIIELRGRNTMNSSWLLLPNNTLVLYKYESNPFSEQENNFIGLSAILKQYKFDYPYGEKSVCVVFDPSGDIHHYGIMPLTLQ
jgi:hypothetical protein